MTVYVMQLPDLECSTIRRYDDIFSDILINKYNEKIRTDYVSLNKNDDILMSHLPYEDQRGATLYCNTGCILYGYSLEHIKETNCKIIFIEPEEIDSNFIGVI